MKPSVLACALAGALALAACDRAGAPVETSLSVAEAMASDTTGYARADRVRDFVFPDDFGPHPDFRTEWWYLTGNLRATDGSARDYGFQFTLFRNALVPPAARSRGRASAWAADQLYLAHVALSDLAAGRFFHDERLERGAAGLAGARADPFRVWLGPLDLRLAPGRTVGEAIPMRLRAEAGGAAYDLTLQPLKPIAFHGERGLSQKGDRPGDASYYFSFTRMEARGTVTVDGKAVAVQGLAWMDREWFTNALAEDQVGWDWFALHLDDGRDLMVYQLRRPDGSFDPRSKGLLVEADGRHRVLSSGEYTLTPEGWWAAPDGARYPVRWRVRVPGEGLDLRVAARLEAQEHTASAVRYWEGAVAVSGSVSGLGYLEMTGYAEAAQQGRSR
ncbi:MAG: lipocalin-like domain-containing protein [Rubricoccaceae bacterium]